MPAANVIFPAFHAPYIFLIPLGFFVVAIEAALLGAFNRRACPWVVFFLYSLGMNLVSTMAGFCLAPSLPGGSGLVVANPDERGFGILGRGPDWHRLAGLSFVEAGLLSIAIEAAVLLAAWRRTGLRRVIIPVVLGNLLSYALLALSFFTAFGH